MGAKANSNKKGANVQDIDLAQLEIQANVVSQGGADEALSLATAGKFNELFSLIPNEYIHKGVATNKWDAERENSITEGIKVILENNVMFEIDNLVLLLGFFWEHKPVRNLIKDKIFADAKEKGLDGYEYLSEVIGKKVEVLAQIESSIQRLKYAINYYKPRENRATKGKTISISLLNEDGVAETYLIGENQLKMLQERFDKDKVALKAELYKVAEKQTKALEL